MSEAQELKKIRSLIDKVLTRREKTRRASAGTTVGVGWPVYDINEVDGALQALLELRISQGPRVKEFEQRFASYVGKKYAVAVNSGSSANLVALTALMQAGKLKKGDEVIVPATTFATVASPVLQLGLVPVYVDVEKDTWNLDPLGVAKAIRKKTKIIMAVHTFGNPAKMREIMAIARRHKALVLEDCCEAHGARIGKKVVGSFGDMATLSFFVAHNITTGEGGMIFTDDKVLYDILTSVREFGRVTVPMERFGYKDKYLGNYDARYLFTRLGYNVRMTDIAAALGLAQLKKLDKLNAKRISIVKQYQKGLAPYATFLILPQVRPGTFHSFYGYPFVIKKDAPFMRQELVDFLESRGIETRPFFGGNLPDQPAFRHEPKRVAGVLPVAKFLREQSIFIGCHPELSQKQVAHVLAAFADFFKSRAR
ncbi:MAG: DegT/DnrJ/EryC1/StrS family aminotransferase [Patescibacteria group bacterium]|nr:DegT/DnrJ/EryC1/StrS family aminotransferase [Patescibacteria group bacterium]